jgi:hypothetical protein
MYTYVLCMDELAGKKCWTNFIPFLAAHVHLCVKNSGHTFKKRTKYDLFTATKFPRSRTFCYVQEVLEEILVAPTSFQTTVMRETLKTAFSTACLMWPTSIQTTAFGR